MRLIRTHQDTSQIALRRRNDRMYHQSRKKRTVDIQRKRWNIKKRNTKSKFTIRKAIKLFNIKKDSYPEFCCTVCQRLLFKVSVSKFAASKYKPNHVAMTARTNIKDNKGNEYICQTCKNHLKKSKIPPQAFVNKMETTFNDKISNLTNFEARLLSLRIPFMKIFNLPKGRQKQISGPVINIPSDVSSTCSQLPRTLEDCGIIPVKLKRRQRYRGHVYYENIRPNKVNLII